MNVLIVLAHPREGSFNHALAGAADDALRARGHRVILHDLYREGFDPVLPFDEIRGGCEAGGAVDAYCAELVRCEGFIAIHPNWWGQPPAIMKGWIDRVVRTGVAYRFQEGDNGEGLPIGLLKGKTGLVFNTSDTPEEREREVFGDPLESIWKRCVFEFCGITTHYRRTFGVIVTSTPEERASWLREAGEAVARYFP